MYVRTEERDGVLAVTIERPERRNALDGEGWRAIAAAFQGLAARPEVRVALLRSSGEVFCGGGDLGWMRSAPRDQLAWIGEALEAMRACPQPVVCRVQGPAYGGGVGLVAAADVVVAGPEAQFTLSEVRLGIAPALISPYVVQRVGPARFRTWALLGTPVDVESAQAAGLVDVLGNQQEFEGKLDRVVEDLRRGEPEALAAIKRLPREGLHTPDAAALLATLRARDAFAEGIAALKDRRPAAWAASPQSVRLVEVGPRDGLQNQPRIYSTECKRRFVEALFAAGLRDVEITSFVRPDLVPQLADAAELFPLTRRDDRRCLVLVANRKGLERALEAGASAISLICAASDGFSRANTGTSAAEGLEVLRSLVAEARPRTTWLRGYVSTCFRCPYDGPVPPEKALAMLDAVAESGVDEVVVSDTLGDATPEQVEVLCAPLLKRYGPERVALHLHDTGGRALACAERALAIGIRTLDGSVGGLGGCPFAPGAAGNVATEALVALCHRLGYSTGVDLAALRQASEILSDDTETSFG